MANPNVPDAVHHTHAERWEMQFAKLVAYQQRFGHCQVPARWLEDPRLANWVRTQRIAYSQDTLKPEHQHRLAQIGFNWQGDPRITVSWEDRLAQLAAFKARFGHCNVNGQWPEDPAFGHWASFQRRLWRKGRLNLEQIRQLEALGFNWQLPDWKPKHTVLRVSVPRGLEALNRQWEKQLAAWRNG